MHSPCPQYFSKVGTHKKSVTSILKLLHGSMCFLSKYVVLIVRVERKPIRFHALSLHLRTVRNGNKRHCILYKKGFFIGKNEHTACI